MRDNDWGDIIMGSVTALLIAALVVFLGWVTYSAVLHATSIESGEIYKKSYTAARNYTTIQTTTTGKTTISVPVQHHDDARYTLWIRQRKDGEAEYETNWADVPADVWDKARIGQRFDGDCYCLEDK